MKRNTLYGTFLILIAGALLMSGCEQAQTEYRPNVPPRVTITSPAEGSFVTGTLTVQGTASDDTGISKVEIAFGAGEPFVRANGSASWNASFDTTTLDDGGLFITVRAQDLDGVFSYSFLTVIIDNEGPTIQIINPTQDQPVSGYVPVIGIGNRVDQVRISIDDGPWQTASGTVVWSLVLDTLIMTEGDHKIAVQGFRTNPPAESTIVERSFVVDKTVPSILFDETAGNPKSGDFLQGMVTFRGTASDDVGIDTVDISVDSGITWSDATGTSSWHFDLATTSLADGPRTIMARAKDVTGLYGTVSIPVTIDNNPPAVAITTPATDSIVSGVVTFTGTATDAVGIKEVFLQFGSGTSFIKVNGTNNWNYDFNATALPNGIYTVTARATDFADNTDQISISVKLDQNAPVFAPVSGIAAGGYYRDTLGISGMVSDPDPSDIVTDVEWSVNGSEFAPVSSFTAGSFSHNFDTTAYTQGPAAIRLRATDNWGRTTTQTWNVYFDNDDPVIAITQPDEDSSEIGGIVFIRGTVTDVSPMSSLTLTILNGATTLLSEPILSSLTDGEWFYRWDSTPGTFPIETDLTIRVNGTDVAGNTSSSDRIVQKTNNIPGIEITSPTSGSFVRQIVEISGTADNGGSGTIENVEIRLDNGVYIPVNNNSGDWTSWSYSLDTTTLAEGSRTITVRVTVDSSGIELTNTTGIQIRVDNIAPVVTIVEPLDKGIDPGPLWGSIPVTASATDTNLISVEYSINNGTSWTAFANPTEPAAVWNTLTPSVIAADDLPIRVRTTDAAGNMSETHILVDVHPFIDNLGTTATTRGTAITITGSNFNAGSRVHFTGAANITPSGWTTTSLTVTVPATARSGAVTVTTNNIHSNEVNLNIWAIDAAFANSANYVSATINASDEIFTAFAGPIPGAGGNRGISANRNLTGTWLTNVVLQEGTTGANEMTWSSIASEGATVHTVYVRGGTELRHSRSLNTGANWSASNQVYNGSVSHTSLAKNGNNLYLAAYLTGSADLVFFTSTDNGDTWSAPTTIEASGDVGQNASLVLDSDGNPRIAYWDATNRRLKLAWNNGSGWSTRVVDTGTGNVGQYTSMAIDSDDGLHISYFDGNSGDTKYAYLSAPDAAPQTEFASQEGLSGFFSSITVDSTGKPHIVMYEFSSNSANYLFKEDGVWHKLMVPGITPIYPATIMDIVVDSTNRPWMFIPTAGGVRCARFIR